MAFPQVTDIHNTKLVDMFLENEVHDMVKECDGNKSPGPDGFNFTFLKSFWGVIKEDIMNMLTEFHNNGKIPKSLLSYFVALVPKVKCLQRVNDFRPISLLGCLYKIISKLLADRMK